MSVTRIWRLVLPVLLSWSAFAQQPPPSAEPPEEDAAYKPKGYSFNPLQAEKEVKTGDFYFKKKNYKAAASRYEEATKWNPGWAEAFFRLGEAREKLNDQKAAREAYAKYLELAPDGKEAAIVKKKLGHKS